MSKVYNNIDESNYIFNYDKLRLYFSSEFYLNKFKKEHLDFLKNETMKMKLKYKCNIYADDMILLLLYQQIEKRGFRVYYDNNRIIKNYLINFELSELSFDN